MTDEQGREPLLPGRGVVLIDDFCRVAGVGAADLEGLVRSGRLQGLVDAHDELFGLFDDVLPTPQELRALGVVVGVDYDIDALRSAVVDDDNAGPDAQFDEGPNWTLSWSEDPNH